MTAKRVYGGLRLFDIQKVIFKTITGSKLYGTDLPNSDTDIRGVFLYIDKSLFYGLKTLSNIKKGNSNEDEEYYELKKFLELAIKNNPNIMDLIWAPKSFWMDYHPLWESVIYKNRFNFLSKKCLYTFSGYAQAQLKRIKTHRRYLLNPPTHKPTRKEFGLLENESIRKDLYRAILSIPSKYFNENIKENVIKEKQYDESMKDWKSYISWKENRNPERKKLEEKSGWDTKHGMHLIRLLLMGKDIAERGEVIVDRRKIDATFLKNVRNGVYSYEEITKKAEDINKELPTLYKKSSLPNEPNFEKINDICIHFHKHFMENR